MQAPVDLKSTVNLPKTDFPMKANLARTEPKLLERWDREQIYSQLRKLRHSAPLFTLHDGPPYANGNIHLGTALNKILKDFIVKSKSMAGFNAPFVPGWDCHGLPIEIKVDQELGTRKAQMPPVEIRRACRKYADKYVALHRRDFKRLGVLGRWEEPYLTMSASYEAVIASAFLDFLEKGYVYKGLKPVHWCIHCRTALAEAEVEYHNHTSPSIWVKFPLDSDPAELSGSLGGRNVSAVIWTTTPWTLPANLALCFHTSVKYAAVASGPSPTDDVYLVAQPLLATAGEKLGFSPKGVLATIEGSRLEKARFRHPFLNRSSMGTLGEHVTMEQGTGIVHTAPGHGQEDFAIGEKYHLEILCPVDDKGRFEPRISELAASSILAEYAGKPVFEANPIIVAILRESGMLLREEKLEHSYPHCWRCRHPVIFRATEQWFINLDHEELRGRSLAATKEVSWIPEWGVERMSNMLAARPYWCISRQRIWGSPIIVFYCEGCKRLFTDRSALAHVVGIFEKETADAWYTRPAAELLPPGTKCRHCGGSQFRQERDILDVWFDSGSSHLAVLGRDADVPWPADLYIEGSDQYRGWFHHSMLVGVALRQRSPFRQVATHGWVLDEQGRAMHKSLGNVIEPQAIINSSGAEILRLWVASQDFREDLRISAEMLERLKESYRKIRNTFRFLLSNLYDFDPGRHQVSAGQMSELDQLALHRMARLVELCRTWYQEYAFHKIYHAVYNFCTVELSAFYLDITKDCLYTAAPDARARRSVQTALYRIADALVRLLAPILCFTSEEVWSHLPDRPEGIGSVHLATFPETADLAGELSLAQVERLHNWDRLTAIREEVLKALEAARREKFIGHPLEAKVELAAEGDWAGLLEEYNSMLPMLFIVSQVHLSNESLPGAAESLIRGLQIAVRRADGSKCERCWNYSTKVGGDAAFPTLCERCGPVVRAL
ncbi:MAG: isoleucine--tRNA ligase [Acidobacteria bacterium]|nr:isoleucine--tRNA ligase [Acidobacteriota bacterium]